MSQYSRGYEQEAQTNETQPVYTPDPIDLQQLEHQQGYSRAQESPFQYQVPSRQGRPQAMAQYTYVQHVFVYPHHEPDSLSKITAAFSYLGFWFSAVLVLVFARHNRFMKFHALQSLFLFSTMTVIYIIFFRLGSFWSQVAHLWSFGRPFFAFLVLVFVLLNVVAAIAWFVGISGAMIGKYVKLPFVGDLAEKLTGGPVQPR